jgi:tRNA A37 threonylcarbamoyladenosine dehydratase
MIEDTQTNHKQQLGMIVPPPPPTSIQLPEELRTEQLSRHTLYFGTEGIQQLHATKVCVVGVGGVGSHAATALVRGGMGHVRIVDFDTVSLSSLNRHACATLADVGQFKVHVLHRYLQQICPDPRYCTIDPIPTMYTKEQGALEILETCVTNNNHNNHNNQQQQLLPSPSTPYWNVVVDAIDDVPTKAALIADCIERNIPVVSCMGAGGKADFTRLHVSDLKSAARDPLATKLRQALKQRFQHNETLFEQICTNTDMLSIIFSSESTVVGLAAMTEEQRLAKEQDGVEFGAVDGMRVRILPVLGTLPAIMGQGLATVVLTRFGGRPIDQPIPGQRLSHNVRHKLLQKYQQRERKWAISHNQDPNVTKWSPKTDPEDKVKGYHTADDGLWFGPVVIDEMDVEYILEVWKNRCCLLQSTYTI